MHAFLDGARRSGTLVRLTRRGVPREDADSDGYVVALGADLVALHVLSDRIDLDGYEVLRLRDLLAAVDGFPGKAFYTRALEMKGEAASIPEGLDLSSRERLAPGEVEIGHVRQVLPSGVRLHRVTPQAVWEEDGTLYRFDSITRLQFGGEYERTLAMVAGPPPDEAAGRPCRTSSPKQEHVRS